MGLLIPVLGIAVAGSVFGASAAVGTAFTTTTDPITFADAFALNTRLILINAVFPLTGLFFALRAFECTSCFDYLPANIAYIAVVYVASQFEVPDALDLLTAKRVLNVPVPLLNFITTVYYYFDLALAATNAAIADNAMFITQVGFLYILFLAPALIAALVFSCCEPLCAAVLASAIAAAVVSVGAIGISDVFSGVVSGIYAGTTPVPISITDITASISFSEFLDGIMTQLVLLAAGVLVVLILILNY